MATWAPFWGPPPSPHVPRGAPAPRLPRPAPLWPEGRWAGSGAGSWRARLPTCAGSAPPAAGPRGAGVRCGPLWPPRSGEPAPGRGVRGAAWRPGSDPQAWDRRPPLPASHLPLPAPSPPPATGLVWLRRSVVAHRPARRILRGGRRAGTGSGRHRRGRVGRAGRWVQGRRRPVRGSFRPPRSQGPDVSAGTGPASFPGRGAGPRPWGSSSRHPAGRPMGAWGAGLPARRAPMWTSRDDGVSLGRNV